MTPTQPKFIDMPFAYNGARNEIPATAGSDDGSATLNDGFPTVTEQPISQGGIPPRRKDFNGILYALSNFQFFAQAGGIFTYDATLDYRTPAMVWYGGNLYICIKNNGASSTVVTPGTNSDYWKDFVEFLNIDTSVAQRLGTATVGSGTKHMYLNAGSPVASSSTVGGSAQGMWLNAGTMQAMSVSAGNSTTPVYFDNGTVKACSRSIPDSSSGGGGGSLPFGVISSRTTGTASITLSANSSGFSATVGQCVVLYASSMDRFTSPTSLNINGTGAYTNGMNNIDFATQVDGTRTIMFAFYNSVWRPVTLITAQSSGGGE